MSLEDFFDCATGKPITRELIRSELDGFCEYFKVVATAEQKETITDYVVAHYPTSYMHGAARVLGHCCHCTKCLNKTADEKAIRE